MPRPPSPTPRPPSPPTSSPETTEIMCARKSVEECIWARVDKTDTCWLWTGPLDRHGYGKCSAGAAKTGQWWRLAHRVVYELENGPIPEGLVLDHLCRVRNCVNPAHLEPVTIGENDARGISPWAENKRKTHCSRGHELSQDNVSLDKSGNRNCIQCRRITNLRAVRRYSAKKKGEVEHR